MAGNFVRRGLLIAALPVLALGAGCNAVLGPSRPDGNWHAYESGHFTLLTRPGSFAEANQARLADALNDQYATTLSALGITYGGHITAFLYTSAADADLESNYSGVAYPETEALRASCVGPLDGNLFSLLSHEANHVIQKNAMGRPGTSFMNEGLPSAVMSTRFHSYGKEFYWAWTASHAASIPAISSLVNDDNWTGSDLQYKASASFLAYLIDRAGPAPIRQLYQTKSSEFASRVNALYGRSLDDLDRDWRAFVAARPSS